MWMVDYNDGGEFNMADHAFNGRKLRPLIPRPMTSPPINTSTATTPCLNRAHATDFFSQYHNLASVTEQSKREFNTSPPVVVSTRWNPTPEQLRALEELYRRGTRTPSAEQIQHITAQLRRFGKIEGKNVFYWFQNHKARERQKRRRQVESAAAEGHHPRDHLDNLEKKDLGAIRTVFEVEQTKNWAPSTNCSTLTEESVSIQRAAAAAKAAVAESRTDGWVQFDELGELEQHQRRNFIEKNATWHMMQSSSCPPPTCSTTSNIATTTATVTGRGLMDPTLIKTHGHLSFFLSPHRENGVIQINSIISSSEEDENRVESQTLQLFPLGSGNINQKETEISVPAMNANLTPSQFFEFLPLKN